MTAPSTRKKTISWLSVRIASFEGTNRSSNPFEPASGLNPKETDELAALIVRIRGRQVTVLLVEHDMSLVMDISDEILVLNNGAPIAEGNPAAIRADREVVSVYLGGDFHSAEKPLVATD